MTGIKDAERIPDVFLSDISRIPSLVNFFFFISGWLLLTEEHQQAGDLLVPLPV